MERGQNEDTLHETVKRMFRDVPFTASSRRIVCARKRADTNHFSPAAMQIEIDKFDINSAAMALLADI